MLVTAAVIVPQRLALAPRIGAGIPYRIAEWTLFAPLSVAAWGVSAAGGAGTTVRPGFAVALLCSLGATSVCVTAVWMLGCGLVRRLVRGVVVAAVAVSVVAGGVVAAELHDAVVAERVFFALVSRAAKPSDDPATVDAAAEFIRRHPLSRWRSEAVRIVAMHAWSRGRYAEAERGWSEFEKCFDDPSAPGAAYAEYNRALCFERLGRARDAIACDRSAIGVIRSRDDGIQGWIAPDAARHIAQLERRVGMPVTAAYWTTQSQTLKDVCSIE